MMQRKWKRLVRVPFLTRLLHNTQPSQAPASNPNRHNFHRHLGPPSLPRPTVSSASREVGTRQSCFIFLGFCFFGGIDEVVATMAYWNKVSPVSPYLDDVRSGADEGPVRVCVSRSVVSFRILAVCVFFKKSIWLAVGVATSTSSYLLFCGLARFLQPSDWC